MTLQLKDTLVPPEMITRLPALALLRAELLSHIITHPAGQALVRAAWNMASIWPLKVQRTYRFGPPAELADAAGFPYHWAYLADDAYTAAWEAQLCRNDVTRPGTFYIDHNAQQALIATLSFSAPLQLLDLTGLAASRLGIYDQLRSPDHGWCQWLGWQLDQIIGRRQARFTVSCIHRGDNPANLPMRYPLATWQPWAQAWHAPMCNSAALKHMRACWPTACAWIRPEQMLPTPARATCP
ncbi:RES domain-containing protein [Janthinobacterium sp. SUN098]|uniref:RES domain-containing protein n=1 Tax=Janthinobacterium sp. SUN098 TaxID=3002437 RepID=UPI0038D4B018